MIVRLKDVRDDISKIIARTDQRGELTGFQGLDKIYSVKQGSFTCVLAAPGHGKSEFLFEIMINQSLRHGKRHMVYSPETGSAAEIMLELAHKYMTKPAIKTSYYDNSATQIELAAALDWVEHHFLIVNGDEEARSYEELCESLLKEEKDSKLRIDCLVAEPYNELRHNMVGYGTRQDLYIEDFMAEVRRFSKKNNKHTFLSFHPGVQNLIFSKDKRVSWYPMPKAREASGGQAALRKAMTWINLWRPPSHEEKYRGEKYKDNELVVVVEKAKPKGVSFRGQATLYFNSGKNRYYEEIDRSQYFAFEHEKIPAAAQYVLGQEYNVPSGFPKADPAASKLINHDPSKKQPEADDLPF